MRIRIAISGIIAGVISQFILKFMVFNIRLGEVMPGWLTVKPAIELPPWLDLALIGAAVFVIFVGGWIAARWNWSRNWNASFLSGAGSGLIAGALAFCFIGAFQAGVEGQGEILASLSRPVSENEGLVLLLNGLVQTALRTYASCGIHLLGGTLSGALGGLASMLIDRNDVWGSPVSARDSWLFRLSGYSLTLMAFFNLIVTIAVTQLLDETAAKTVVEKDLWNFLPLPPTFIYLLAVFAGIVLMCAPLALTWGWTLRDWTLERKRPVISGLWFLLTFGYVIYWAVNYFLQVVTLGNIMLLPLGSLLLFLGVLIAIGWNIKRTPEPEWTSYRFDDRIGYILTNAILGGAQLMAGIIAYAVSMTQITIVAIPHLMNQNQSLTASVGEQIHFLYAMQIRLSFIAMGVSVVLALILSWLTGFFRWVFEKEKKTPLVMN